MTTSTSFRRDLRKLAKKMGWTIQISRGSHTILKKDGIHGVIHASLSPSCSNAIHHIRADMRRAERLGFTGKADDVPRRKEARQERT